MISTEIPRDQTFRKSLPLAVIAGTLTYWLALTFVFVIPLEGAVMIPGVGRLSRMVGMLLAASWCFTVLITGKTRMPKAFHLLALTFVMWNALTVFWTHDVVRSGERVFTYLQLAVMVAIIWDMFASAQRLRSGMQAYVCGSVASAIGTIYNYSNRSEFVYERFAAGGLHVDDLGILLGLALPIAFYLAVSGERSAGYHRILKFANFLTIPLLTFAIFLTGTRAALLASAPAFLYMMVSVAHLRPVARFVLIGGIAAILIAILPYIPKSSWQRMGTIQTELSQGDLNGRIQLWKRGLDVFAENPLIGTGSNSFPTATNSQLVAHNSFISILTESGMIGFGLILAIGFLTLSSVWRRPHAERLFWLSLIAVLVIGISTLTWEHRKPTWLILSFAVIAGNLAAGKDSDSDVSPNVSSS